MPDLFVEAAGKVFQYPVGPLQRRHGPRGYVDYRAYKPWLRDECWFRCAYCLCRERWEPNGQDVFSVEHIQPQVTHPERVCDYDNLLYSCSICNAYRGVEPLPFDPCAEAMATHLQTLPDGTVEGLTAAGRLLCEMCHLNRPLLIQFRRQVQELIALLLQHSEPKARAALQRLLGLPEDLPNLRLKRPPSGNSRPGGIAESCFERRKRGDLPPIY